MIQYSGNVRKITGITGATRQALINNIVDQLEVCGWTVISGEGTGTVVLRSGQTPNGLRMKVKIHTNCNAAVCGFVPMNDAETRTGTADLYSPGFLQYGTQFSYSMIASPYQVFIFTNGYAARESVAWGIPWLPSHITGVTNVMWMIADVQSDTSTTYRGNWRVATIMSSSGWCIICNDVVTENRNDAQYRHGMPQIFWYTSSDIASADTDIVSFATGQIPLWDPLICGAINGNRDSESVILGQLWDCVVATEVRMPLDSTVTFDGHTWQLMTLPVVPSTVVHRGQILLATN